jgi:hypothetical protein
MFGTDPIPDVTVESLEAKQNTQDVLKETATEITHSKTKQKTSNLQKHFLKEY